MFVGCRQTYTNTTRTNVNQIVKTLIITYNTHKNKKKQPLRDDQCGEKQEDGDNDSMMAITRAQPLALSFSPLPPPPLSPVTALLLVNSSWNRQGALDACFHARLWFSSAAQSQSNPSTRSHSYTCIRAGRKAGQAWR